jgi:hypothetical protein
MVPLYSWRKRGSNGINYFYSLEQASKVVMWTPTRPDNGEGSTDREETRAGTRNWPTNEHLIRSTGVLSTACREGGLGQ